MATISFNAACSSTKKIGLPPEFAHDETENAASSGKECQALGGRPPINATIPSISTLLGTMQFDARFRAHVTEGAAPGEMSRVYQDDALG